MEIENRYDSSKIKAEQQQGSTVDVHETYSPELMNTYYAHLFPYNLLYSWLSYNSKKKGEDSNSTNPSSSSVFAKREFSFTIEPSPGEEIYIRYQSFTGPSDLRESLLKRRPTKIDLGAVFSHPPKDSKSLQKSKNVPEQRELVFDIDLTDYDDVRACGCQGAAICSVCWGFMKMAVRVLDVGLRQDFGFRHIAWFYSGRRGIHAWVCDEGARLLSDEGRSAVAHYLEVELGSERNKDVILPDPLHPMMSRAYEILEPMFIEQVLPESGHGLLATPDRWNGFLDSLPEKVAMVRDKLKRKWANSNSNPEEKWISFKKHLEAYRKTIGKPSGKPINKSAKILSTEESNRLNSLQAEIVFRYTYPRLDINVSKMRNHLLKSPFCIHPKTGRVCVPIQASKIDSFDPFAVPTLSQVVRELDCLKEETNERMEVGDTNDENKPVPMETSDKGNNKSTVKPTVDANKWQKTSLRAYYEPFQKEFLEPLQRDLLRQEREVAEVEASRTIDF